MSQNSPGPIPSPNQDRFPTVIDGEEKVGDMIRVSFFPEQPEYREGEAYTFEVSIHNQSAKRVFPFKIFDDPFQQFSFTIKKGYQDYSIKHLNYYRFLYDRHDFSDKHKTITLNYRESYSRIVSLSDFFVFEYPGFYEITGEFYPLGVAESDYRIPIQPFVLRIHPGQATPSRPSDVSQATIPRIPNNNNQVAPIPSTGDSPSLANVNVSRQVTPFFPSEVIADHFNRIKIRDYAGYLKNLELEKLLVNSYRSSEPYQRYQGAKHYEKEIIIEDFKNFLFEQIDYTLVDSAVLKTTVIDEKAVVEAVAAIRQAFENYREVIDPQTGKIQSTWIKESINRLERFYHFTFNLEMIPQPWNNTRPWKIIGYEVLSLSADEYRMYKRRYSQTPPRITYLEPLQQQKDTKDYIERIINFDYNRSDVTEEYIPQISKLAQFLIAYPQLLIELSGHTDESGEESYNYELSKRRVESVVALLLAAGVNLDRMRFYYRGESQPLTRGLTEEERRLNRRVEIKIFNPQP